MYRIRSFSEADRGFIVDTFCQSYYGAAAVRGMQRDDFFPWLKRKVNRMLDMMDVYVATSENDADAILGWAIMEPTAAGWCLHYVYVRPEVRGFGIARELVSRASYPVDRYSHRSRHVRQPPVGWSYRPDLAEISLA